MKKTRQRIATLLIFTFMAQMLMGCASAFKATPGFSPATGQATPAQVIVESPNPAYAMAQATMDSGQSQLLDLSRKATEVSLNMSQAANPAALSTQEYNQRQKMELDYQSTIISLNITQAAGTQKFINQQTKMASDAAAVVQRTVDAATQAAYLVNVTQGARAQAILDAQVLQTDQAAAALTALLLTATYAAFERNITETAHAQMILNVQATQTAQAVAALTAYPLTATPFAVTKAALLSQEYGREQQSFVNKVVIPLIPILAALVLLLFILVIVMAYRRSWSMPWPRRLRFRRVDVNPSPLIMIEAVIADRDPRFHPISLSELTPANPPRLPGENELHVEIVDANEQPVAHWIAEVEQQLTPQGGL